MKDKRFSGRRGYRWLAAMGVATLLAVGTASAVLPSSGTAATIAPEVMADNIAMTSDVLRLRLVEPLIEKPVGVVISEREPVLPAVEALMSCMKAARQ